MNNHGVGTYDTFGGLQPDVYITSASLITQEAIDYLSKNPIMTVINVQNIRSSEVLGVEEILQTKR